jgi:hypothetical protein
MLFGPITSLGLDAARILLDGWNGEADRFRAAAIGTRHGNAPSPDLLEAMDDVHDGLMELIGDIDRALERAAPGQQERGILLQMQVTALALSESIGRSQDMMDVALPARGATAAEHADGNLVMN